MTKLFGREAVVVGAGTTVVGTGIAFVVVSGAPVAGGAFDVVSGIGVPTPGTTIAGTMSGLQTQSSMNKIKTRLWNHHYLNS